MFSSIHICDNNLLVTMYLFYKTLIGKFSRHLQTFPSFSKSCLQNSHASPISVDKIKLYNACDENWWIFHNGDVTEKEDCKALFSRKTLLFNIQIIGFLLDPVDFRYS